MCPMMAPAACSTRGKCMDLAREIAAVPPRRLRQRWEPPLVYECGLVGRVPTIYTGTVGYEYKFAIVRFILDSNGHIMLRNARYVVRRPQHEVIANV